MKEKCLDQLFFRLNNWTLSKFYLLESVVLGMEIFMEIS